MEEVRRLASLTLAKRAEAKLKVRQPLAELRIKNYELREDLNDILKEEVNVKKIIFDDKIENEVELDTKITATLKKEGLIRELTRMIQGLRQDAGLEPKDRITLYLKLSPAIKKIVTQAEKQLVKAVGADALNYKQTEKFTVELETKLDEEKIWIGIKKV